MPFSPATPHEFKFQHAWAPFVQADEFPLPEVLPADDVAQLFGAEQVSFGGSARAFWTLALTRWTFLGQIRSADQSCRQAVAQALLAFALTRPPAELDTAAYCRARAQLPAKVLQRLTTRLAEQLAAAAPDSWRWHGRHVRLVDGSTSRLPDTPENQQAFPQPPQQKRGLGFPIIRWVLLASLATAALHGLAYGPYAGKETGATALFRQLLAQLRAGDVLVADRYYCSYFLVALLLSRGVDVVFRLHQRRKYDFRRGQRWGRDDHEVSWHKPARPAWLDEETYAALPATIQVREIRRQLQQPGGRVREIVVATRLLDAAAYAADEVAERYHQRWHVELDIRTLKVTLGMDQLRCQTPAMIAKEIWAHALAYNRVRKVAAQAAAQAGVSPRSISFQATKPALLGGWLRLTANRGAAYLAAARLRLRLLPQEKVGHRPGRCEPRAVKGRPKPQKRLREPRAQARARLLKTPPPKKRRGERTGRTRPSERRPSSGTSGQVRRTAVWPAGRVDSAGAQRAAKASVRCGGGRVLRVSRDLRSAQAILRIQVVFICVAASCCPKTDYA